MLVLRYSRATKPVSFEITLTIQKSIIIYMFLDSEFYDNFKSVKILELRPCNRMEMLVLRYSRAAKPVSYEITLTLQKSIIINKFFRLKIEDFKSVRKSVKFSSNRMQLLKCKK